MRPDRRAQGKAQCRCQRPSDDVEHRPGPPECTYPESDRAAHNDVREQPKKIVQRGTDPGDNNKACKSGEKTPDEFHFSSARTSNAGYWIKYTQTMKRISITVPADVLDCAIRLARSERRSLSDLICEALARYERREWWDEMNAYGRRTAAKAGLRSEEAVVRAIRAWREHKGAR